MGSGSFTARSFSDYATSKGRTYNTTTNRIDGDYRYKRASLSKKLNPSTFDFRECANSEEHPNTIPVILGLDVTGSMGEACKETAKALGSIMSTLYESIPDVEFCIMGIGDIEWDTAPIQMSQFESDVRIAKCLDSLYIEHGGGGNGYETYTTAWYMGLRHTKLDCYDKQNRKGIIITMGDEPLNPKLNVKHLKVFINDNFENDIVTEDLYEIAKDKFDIFHISIDDPCNSYTFYKKKIDETFGKLLGERHKVSTIQDLGKTILNCIRESVNNESITKEDEISW